MESKKDDSVFLIDFLNIAYLSKENGNPRLSNYEKVRDKLKSINPKAKVLAIADPHAYKRINYQEKYEALIDKGEIIQVGSGEEADYYMIQYAKPYQNCCIISNDSFKDHNLNRDIKKRIIPVCIINNEVIFSKKLKEFPKNSNY